MVERLFIRILVSSFLCSALVGCALVPIPSQLPSPAFEQTGIYRLEIALIFFYGALLLVTPLVAGLARGRLPVEISTRGARFAADTGQSAGRNEESIRELEGAVNRLRERLTETRLEIEQLKKEVTIRDRR